MKRKTIAAVIITTVALSLAACGGTADDATDTLGPRTEQAAWGDAAGNDRASDISGVGSANHNASANNSNAEGTTSENSTVAGSEASANNSTNNGSTTTDITSNLPDTLTDTLSDLETTITTANEEFTTTATIEQTVLIDESDIKITATDLTYTGYSVDLDLSIENNTDKNLSFASGTVGYCCSSINNCMIKGGYLNADVASGKKAKETISFSLTELEMYGITEIADIQVGFEVKDDNYDEYFRGSGQVWTSAADTYDYTVNTYRNAMDSKVLEVLYDCIIDYYVEQELYNESGVNIVSQALITNEDGEQAIFLEVVNNSAEMVNVSLSNTAVNGLVLYGGTWTMDTISPGARCIMEAEVTSMMDAACWELFGLSNIDNFSCFVTVKDAEYTEIIPASEINIAISEEITPLDNAGTELYNENGIRIISKGIVEDSSDYSDTVHMLFLAENQSSKSISIDDTYDSFSLNGYMTDCIMYPAEISSGRSAVLDVQIYDSDLEESDITAIEDIAEAELTFEIRDKNYKLLAEPAVTISY